MSWLIQSRLADVATIVDENVNGVRVVKSFAAEDQQLKALANAATKVQWGYVKDADLRARWTPAIQNLPQLGLVLVLLFGGWMVIQHHLGIGAILAFNVVSPHDASAVHDAGHAHHDGPAGCGLRLAHLRDTRRALRDRRPPGAVDLVDSTGDVPSTVSTSLPGEDRPLVLAGFDLHLDAPARPCALVGRTGSGKSTVARLLHRATTSRAAPCGSTARTCGT